MKKKIVCPVCQGRLFDMDSAMELEVQPLGQDIEFQNTLYVKCSKCGKICAATFGEKKEPPERISRQNSQHMVTPVTAVFQEMPVPLEIKLNITYSVQS